jgi:hypothetical protein
MNKTHSKVNTSQELNERKSLEEVAEEKFGDSYGIKTNESDSYSLVYKNYKKYGALFSDIHYFIYFHQEQLIIFEDKLKEGSLDWISDDEIVAITRNITNEFDSGTHRRVYYYNVSTRQMTLKKE